MFKVISAEIKKMLSKPGIYILALLLAVILVSGVFIYNPTSKQNNYIELAGDTVLTKYTDYYSSATAGKKLIYDDMISDSIKSVKYYIIENNGNSITHQENVQIKLDNYQTALKSYLDCAHNTSTGVDQHIKDTVRPNLISSLTNLHTAIDIPINQAKNGSYAIITTQANYEKYSQLYEEILKFFEQDLSKDKIAEQYKEYQDKYEKSFLDCIAKLNYPTLNTDLINTLTTNAEGSKLSIIQARLAEIDTRIETLYNEAKISTEANLNQNKIKEFEDLANAYFATARTYSQMVKYELISIAFDTVTTSEQMNLMFLSEESKYNSNSLAIRYNYLFENNKTDFDYANPLTIGVSSNENTNAYDYTYFILKLFGFVIIIYAVMSACQTIAGEMKEGSLRYFAIRPVTRNNVYLGKMLAILLISVIMIIFSAIIALCVGGYVYGFSTLEILTIFNGKIAVTMPAYTMLLIYLTSFLFELIIYLSIAMLLSCLLKSDLLAVTIILVVYLLNLLLPVFVQGANSWLTYYPFSHISFYSLFGSSVYASDSLFNMLLGAKVYAGTNLGLTLMVILLMIVIVNTLSVKIFKHKEL